VGSPLAWTNSVDVRGAALGSFFEINVGIPASVYRDPIEGRYDPNSGWLVSAWVDWNQDGDWDDAGEQVAASSSEIQDQLGVRARVPASAKTGITYGRVRISTQPNLGPTGSAPDGYVDDFQVYIAPTDTTNFTTDTNGFAGLVTGIASIAGRNGAAYQDFNRDGIADIYVTRSETVVFVDDEGLATEKSTIAAIPNGFSTSRSFLGDINGDGYPDIIESGYVDADTVVAVSSFNTANVVAGWWDALSGTNVDPRGVVDYDGDTYTFSINGKTESGEPHAFQGVCKRRVRAAPETGEAARCPWTWMLGQWKVKRSDDTTASVTWEQPSEEVDVLVGRWTESDGSVLTEQVGWQPDRKQLVANAYGAEGVFFSVLFNKVDKDQMSGWYRNRNAEGEVVNGKVEINRISETEVRSKLVERDGTVLTEVFTKVQ
jgi:hypothetical protein